MSYVANDPVNFIDSSGNVRGSTVLGGLAAVCIALDFYEAYETAQDLKALDAEIASTKSQIDVLEASLLDITSDNCPNAEEQVANLKKQYLILQSKRSSAAGKGSVTGIGTAAICSGITKAAAGD